MGVTCTLSHGSEGRAMMETTESVLDMGGVQDWSVSVGGKRGGHPLFPPILSMGGVEGSRLTELRRRGCG